VETLAHFLGVSREWRRRTGLKPTTPLPFLSSWSSVFPRSPDGRTIRRRPRRSACSSGSRHHEVPGARRMGHRTETGFSAPFQPAALGLNELPSASGSRRSILPRLSRLAWLTRHAARLLHHGSVLLHNEKVLTRVGNLLGRRAADLAHHGALLIRDGEFLAPHQAVLTRGEKLLRRDAARLTRDENLLARDGNSLTRDGGRSSSGGHPGRRRGRLLQSRQRHGRTARAPEKPVIYGKKPSFTGKSLCLREK
jgi:hypothetical protein